MADQVARLGDPSSHGGYILSVSTQHSYSGGKLIARVGDLHSCPIKGHGVTPIIATPATTKIVEGKQVACVGSVTGCGAIITAGDPTEFTT